MKRKMNIITVLGFLLGISLSFDNAVGENISGKFRKTAGKRDPNTFQTITVKSRLQCCAFCLQTADCKSANHNNISKQCQLSSNNNVAINLVAETNNTWNIYSKDEWMLVFRGTQGAGSDIYFAWAQGTNVTTDDVACMTTDVTSCVHHYRNPIVDSWASTGVTQVKFAFYKDGTEVVYVIFDATGSNITNWFDPAKIEDSSWTTLSTQTFNFFSITGDEPGRRFFINHAYGGCPADSTYTVALAESTFGCAYDIQTSYPQFYYSNTDGYGYPETMTDIDQADVLAIFIK